MDENNQELIQFLLDYDEDAEIDINFVKAEAGDIQLAPAERRAHKKIKKARGQTLYVDMLLVLTHKYFPIETAESIWNDILNHKETLAQSLNRSVGIVVAALDYLSNISGDFNDVVVIPAETLGQVSEVALKDSLTKLFDKGTFQTKLENEFKRLERYGTELSLILIDIDHFKRVNDTHGHTVGDLVLSRVGEMLRRKLRDVEIVARVGGEEFAALLPQSGLEQAYAAAERVREAIKKQFEHDYKITVSAGVASCSRATCTPRDLVMAADRALYTSKQRGRNRTTKARGA
jgi:diguanylate cyclase (GGDEF)-like protein